MRVGPVWILYRAFQSGGYCRNLDGCTKVTRYKDPSINVSLIKHDSFSWLFLIVLFGGHRPGVSVIRDGATSQLWNPSSSPRAPCRHRIPLVLFSPPIRVPIPQAKGRTCEGSGFEVRPHIWPRI